MPDNTGWDQLNEEQAMLLRSIRKDVYAVRNALAGLASKLLTACPHVDEERLTTCRVCVLYRAFQDAASATHETPHVLDTALQDGPPPNRG